MNIQIEHIKAAGINSQKEEANKIINNIENNINEQLESLFADPIEYRLEYFISSLKEQIFQIKQIQDYIKNIKTIKEVK